MGKEKSRTKKLIKLGKAIAHLNHWPKYKLSETKNDTYIRLASNCLEYYYTSNNCYFCNDANIYGHQKNCILIELFPEIIIYEILQ